MYAPMCIRYDVKARHWQLSSCPVCGLERRCAVSEKPRTLQPISRWHRYRTRSIAASDARTTSSRFTPVEALYVPIALKLSCSGNVAQP